MRNAAQGVHSEERSGTPRAGADTGKGTRQRPSGASGGGRDLAQVMQRQLRDCRSLTATAAFIGQRGEL